MHGHRPHPPNEAALLRQRRDSLDRYARVLSDQLRALQQGELDEFITLQGREREVREGMESEGPVHEFAAGLPEEVGVIQEIRETLHECVALQDDIRCHVSGLRAQILEQLRASTRQPGAKRELIQRYISADAWTGAEAPPRMVRQVG